MKMKSISLVAISLLYLSCCTKPDDKFSTDPPHAQEQIQIPSTVNVRPVVPSTSGETKITFTAGEPWTASVTDTKTSPWVDISPKSGNPGPSEITIITSANDTYVERTATIQIKCGSEVKDIILTQEQLDNITIITKLVELDANEETFTIALKSNIEYKYDISGDWIKYVSTKAYLENILTFHADANKDIQKREGSVTITGGGKFSETVKIYQNCIDSTPVTMISLDKTSITLKEGCSETLIATVKVSLRRNAYCSLA